MRDEPINLLDYEELARERMDRVAYDYYAGGSGDEQTLARNRRDFRRILLRPRVLVGVERIDPSTSVLGTPVSFPVLLAPTALNRLAHPEGERGAARAAGAAGTVMVASTLASSTLEEIAEAATGPLWFQLYVYKDRALSRDLVVRAEAAGYRALVLTVDTPQLGRREKDVRNRFSLPPGIGLRNFEAAGLERADAVATGRESGLASYAHQQFDPSFRWEDLGWLRSISRLPLAIKGILTAEDARRAVEAGVDAIVVSNHGGRQLDGVPSSIRALPEVAEAAGGALEVLMDGGIRRGTDVLKALGMGARAVMIGRPYLWGLAVGGEDGVRHVLQLLRSELELAMALSGRPDAASWDRSLVMLDDDTPLQQTAGPQTR